MTTTTEKKNAAPAKVAAFREADCRADGTPSASALQGSFVVFDDARCSFVGVYARAESAERIAGWLRERGRVARVQAFKAYVVNSHMYAGKLFAAYPGSAVERDVLTMLALHMTHDEPMKAVTPSVETLATLTGYKSRRVRYALATLTREAWIEPLRARIGSGG